MTFWDQLISDFQQGANLDTTDHIFSCYHTALTGRSYYVNPTLLHLFTFLSQGDSWTNIISELYCPSWHLNISRACFHPSTPQWACKCSVLHRPTETKARTRAGRNRPPFTRLPCLTHSDWNQANPHLSVRADTISESAGQLFSGKQLSLQASETLKGLFCALHRSHSLPFKLIFFLELHCTVPHFAEGHQLQRKRCEQQCTSTEPHKPCMWDYTQELNTAQKKALHIHHMQ